MINIPFSETVLFPDIICFSHIRWEFVLNRPQHLMLRFTSLCRVFFIEDPIETDEVEPYLEIVIKHENLLIIKPCLPKNISLDAKTEFQNILLKEYLETCDISEYIFWYYTPMAVDLLPDLRPLMVVYDSMNEFSTIENAPEYAKRFEEKLFAKSSVVFTNGDTLFDAIRRHHPEIYPFPNSVDAAFFAQARKKLAHPRDQQVIPHPLFGFAGIIDERMNFELIKTIAALRPNWYFTLVGPVVVESEKLPRADNIHYAGFLEYTMLPAYMSEWDVAVIPFQLNKSTEFIHPVKTLEYLAAGKPVISTAIPDVERTYKQFEMVQIVHDANEFITVAEKILSGKNLDKHREVADEYVFVKSWDLTWNEMLKIIAPKLKTEAWHTKSTFSTAPKM